MSLFFGNTFMFFSVSNYMTLYLIFMSLVVYLFISFSETCRSVWMYSTLSVVFSVFYFSSTNLLVFYMMFELVMIPIVFVVLMHGAQPEKVSSVYYAVLYTGAFSMPFFYEMLHMEGWLVSVYSSPFMLMLSTGLFLAKVPMYFLHTWLPKTHVEAPSSASMLLAGILLKVGLFGLLKFFVLLNTNSFIISLMSLMGLTVVSLMACVSVETKVITALSSISHMNFALYGANILSLVSTGGTSLLALSHGLVSAMMFSYVGIVYLLNGTRVMVFLTGLFSNSLFLGLSVMSIYLANCGIPPMLSFWGEVMIMVVLMNNSPLLMVFLMVFFMYSFYFSLYMLMHFSKAGGSSMSFFMEFINTSLLMFLLILSLNMWMV